MTTAKNAGGVGKIFLLVGWIPLIPSSRKNPAAPTDESPLTYFNAIASSALSQLSIFKKHTSICINGLVVKGQDS